MKRSFVFAASTVVLSAAALLAGRAAWSSPEAAAYAGDPVHSSVLFRIKHMGASWVWGRFDDFSVSIEAGDAGTPVSSVTFDVKTASVDTGNEGRDKHVKTPDFLNAAQFPDITFKSTKVKALSADDTEVTGDLTLHGVTKPLTVKVSRVGVGAMKGTQLIGFETTFTVKRSDFGMSGMIGPVGDDVMLVVSTETSKK